MPQTEAILHYHWPDLLPPDTTLAFHPTCGTLHLLQIQHGQPRLIEAVRCSPLEATLLWLLLTHYPKQCLLSEVLASYLYGSPTADQVEACHRQIQAALQAGCLDQQMRSLRNILSRLRHKLHLVNIEIATIVGNGAILQPLGEAVKQRSSYQRRTHSCHKNSSLLEQDDTDQHPLQKKESGR